MWEIQETTCSILIYFLASTYPILFTDKFITSQIWHLHKMVSYAVDMEQNVHWFLWKFPADNIYYIVLFLLHRAVLV